MDKFQNKYLIQSARLAKWERIRNYIINNPGKWKNNS
jgi:hypothetical protein